MYRTINYIKNKFYEIQNVDWHKSIRNGSTGVGATFEKLLGLNENNLEFPDLIDLEIKTHRNFSSSQITLFNCTPEGPEYHEVERLKNLYGYPDQILTTHKVLNVSVCANSSTIVRNIYLFKINVDRINKKVRLQIGDIFLRTYENDVYWSFDLLEEKIYRKLKFVAFIYAKRKLYKKCEYFNYYKLHICKLKTFDDFLKALENGKIRITFKVSVFRSGARIGQIHDHGTGFTIKKEDLSILFDEFVFE